MPPSVNGGPSPDKQQCHDAAILRPCLRLVFPHEMDSGVITAMKIVRLVLTCALWTSFAFGQFTTKNPLDELKDQVARVLADAGVPFTCSR